MSQIAIIHLLKQPQCDTPALYHEQAKKEVSKVPQITVVLPLRDIGFVFGHEVRADELVIDALRTTENVKEVCIVY